MTPPINFSSISVALNELFKNVDYAHLYNIIGNIIDYSVQEQFKTEGGFFGTPWAELAPSTIARRKAMKKWPGKKLQISARLASSFFWKASVDGLQFGTNVVYAKYLSEGTSRMPARPIMPATLPQSVLDQIDKKVAAYFKEKLG